MRASRVLYKCTLVLSMAAIGGGSGCPAQEAASGDWVVLRDLQVLREPVAHANAAGIEMASGATWGWEHVVQLEAAAIPAEAAADFLRRVGLPAARVRWRLEIGDWAGAGELSESLLSAERVAADGDRGETAGVLWLARMAAERDRGELTGALHAYLRALEADAGQPVWQARLPAALQLPESLDREAYRLLPPLWLDSASNAAVWQALTERNGARSLESRSDMELVYLFSLAIAEKHDAELSEVEAQLRARSTVWSQVLEWQRMAVRGLPQTAADRDAAWQASAEWPELPQALGRYWLALAQLQDPAGEFERASLRMLSVPASLGTRCPELSAAAIAAVATASSRQGDATTAEKLVGELQTNYRATWTARNWQTPSSKDP